MAIYLDNAATSYPKPEAVYQAVEDYQRNIGVSPGRGAYQRALQAEQLVFNTRRALGQLFNISDLSRIIFTANVTEALNLALKGLLGPEDHVITTSIEHNAVWRPLMHLKKERNIRVTRLANPEGCQLDVAELEEVLGPGAELVVVNHASNVTGAIMPLQEIGSLCQEYEVPLLFDSAQTAGVLPIDVEKAGISLLGFTGHKGLLGPTGTGGLYLAPEIELKPLKEGGTGSKSYLETQPEDLPDRYESGTPNTMGLAGLKAGVEYILDRGLDEIRARELQLTEMLLEKLNRLEGCEVYGPGSARERVAVVSFNLASIPAAEAAYVLDEVYDIMVRAGLHCAPVIHRELGLENRGSLRVSPGLFTEKEELDQLEKALEEILAR